MSPENIETTIITTMTLKFQTSILAILLCISLSTAASSASEPDSTNQQLAQEFISYFDIPAQPLLDALLEYGQQAHISIIFPTKGSSISTYKSSSLVGYYSLNQALKVLLSKTPYAFHFNESTQSITLNTTTIVDSYVASSGYKDQDYRLEEVFIVSARHRPENLQDVPMSISLFSGENLEQNGIQDFIQLGTYAVNTTLKLHQGSNSTMAAFIRGVGYKDPIAGVDVGVGIYINDVYIHRTQGVTLDLYNIERVEILRGPQGTLYGRNTTGGAIKYTTKRLTEESSFDLKLSAGSYNQRDIIASGSTPIATNIFKIGGSIASFHRDGFGSNLATGDENYNKEILGLRSTIEITPSDNLFIRISGDLTKDTSSPVSGKKVLSDNEGSELSNIYDTRAGIANSNHPINTNYVAIRGISSYAQWTAREDLTLTFISAYRRDYGQFQIDFDALENLDNDSYFIHENQQSSQEFRIAYNNPKIHALFGLYYLNANSRSITDIIQKFFNIYSVGFAKINLETKSWAIFSSVDIKLTDTVNVSLGARYTYDKKTMKSFTNLYSQSSSGDFISPYFGGDGFAYFLPEYDNEGNEVFPNFKGSRSDTATTPRISLSWQPTDEFHIYTSYSKGFTNGGFDPRGFYTQPSIRKGFEPETIDNYELGFKSLFLDGGISSNFALFYSDYKNAHILYEVEYASSSSIPTGEKFVTLKNSAKATISGLELELTARFSDNFISNLSIGLIDADYTFYDEGKGDVSDHRVIQDTPKTTASYSSIYRSDWGDGELSMIFSINYRSASSFNRRELERPASTQPSYSLIDASISWQSNNEAWQLGIHCKNLSNKQYKVSGYAGTSLDITSNISSNIYGHPRTITATVKYSL